LVSSESTPPGAGELFGDGRVVGGGRDYGNVVKILGGGADHGRSADVDVLDQFFESYAGLGGGFFESVRLTTTMSIGLDARARPRRRCARNFRGDAGYAVNLGMQRLYAAIEHSGKPVSSEMSLTATPESRSNLAGAPVEMSSMPSGRACARTRRGRFCR